MLRKLWSLTLLTLVAALLPLVPAGAQEPDPPEPPTPVEITEGALTWGVRTSFTRYVSAEQAHPSDGATIDEERGVTFPLVSGTYDEATGSTEIQFAGQVRYASYCGYSGIPDDVCLLDITIKDPRVVITPDEQTLYAHLVSRPEADENVEIVDFGVLPLVNLDISQALVETVDDVTSWSGVFSALTEVGAPAFGGFYSAGIGFDPVAFSYTGPGGAPDVGETWTEPGTPMMGEANRWTQEGSLPQPDALFADETNGVLHLVSGTIRFGTAPLVRAFDSATLEPVPSASYGPPESTRFFKAFDPATSTVFVSLSGTVEGVSSYLIDAVTFDPVDKAYDVVRVATIPNNTVNMSTAAAWDRANNRLVALGTQRVPGDSSIRIPSIYTWELQDGIWVGEVRALPDAPEGYTTTEYYEAPEGGFTVASDGTMIITRHSVKLDGTRLLRPRALAVTVSGDAATVVEIPGTGSDELSPDGQPAYDNPYLVVAGGDGVLWFSSFPVPGQRVQQARVIDGVVELVGGLVDLPPNFYQSMTVDPSNGTLWLKAQGVGALAAVRDGRLVYDRLFANFGRLDDMAVSADHILYSTYRDDLASPAVPGIARFTYEGTSPTVTDQPEPVTATLGVGESSEEVTFTTAGIGDPAPEIQWQARPRGTTTFADVEGETSETLTVEATASDDGTQYRAVLSNLAGELVTEPATLTVLTAPTVGLQPTDLSVIEGEPAEFATQGGGNPEPDIAWQRYSGGCWTTIGPDEDQFEIDGGFLTVLDTNTDMSGAQFRARISNEVATVYSDVVTLTVLPDLPPPPDTDFDDVPPEHPFFEQISWLVDNEITEGYDDGSFRGQSDITRQAVAAFLYRFAGEPEVPDDAPEFTDVPGDHPFHEAISWLAAEEITTGYDDDTFRGDQLITREAVATFLYRFAGEPEVPDDAPEFTDVSADHPFYEAISWLAAEGIAEGYEDGSFRPADNVTREAVAAFLFAYAQLEG